MSHPSNTPDKSPLTQDDQPDEGAIKGDKNSGNDGRERNLSQGSEPETRGTSRGR
ncbi:hypothetical protein HNO88_000201 [Novosphingobium chloroacetimidivorans]|uniref:Uncharacterized protein n=1 Tax=Novosphingobium chloroacetimidivorans TaxID=1428314 RepID=A0A7W7K602_9SPHN|nr:hypothetical protein [Novosphingobium chloroacetimidivorans]MBB4856904.1 hypothetical protein [Novosphingobium chloroacetimidivorans]